MPTETAPESTVAEERELELDDFSGRIGDSFRIRLSDGQERTLRLVTAASVKEADGTDKRATQFALVFHDAAGSIQDHLPQGTYQLEHIAIGGIDLFIVPIGMGDGGEGIEYEAVFNRMCL